MENLDLKKLSQAIKHTANKIKFCATLAVVELNEDEVDGLSRILEECVDEMEQAANTVELLNPAEYRMKRKQGGKLHAVSYLRSAKINSVTIPDNAKELQPA